MKDVLEATPGGKSLRNALLCGMTILPVCAIAASPENFQVKTTKDLVTLCATPPDSSDYAMAISFCHGFAVGAYQYYSHVSNASGTRFVCFTEPPPTRTQAVADFVAWAKAHPELNGAPPIDTLFRYLGERYPCRS